MQDASGSNFDESAFANMEIMGASSTEYVPVPEKDYVAMVDSVKFRVAKESKILDVVWALDDPQAKEVTGMAKPTVRQSIFLDFDGQSLDMGKGKNVQLGLLRDAVGLNDPSQPFRFTMLVGRPAKVSVKHRPDKEDPKKVYTDVKGVTKL